MRVHVNGEELDVKAGCLADLLDELGFAGDWLATAVNSELVTAGERPACQIHDHDRIEILSPMQGG